VVMVSALTIVQPICRRCLNGVVVVCAEVPSGGTPSGDLGCILVWPGCNRRKEGR